MRTDRDAPRDDGQVVIYLTGDEALVLFDLLARSQDDDGDDVVRPGNRAEQSVLWALRGTLDEVLVEPFQHDYGALIAAARSRMVEGSED